MTDTYQIAGSTTSPCTRGCTHPRKHATDCEDHDTCTGCLPRPAEHGTLCYGCHKRLENLLKAIPGQHRLLLIAAIPTGEQKLTQETTAKIRNGWRTSTEQRDQGPYARSGHAAAESSEPIRSAALDAAQSLTDWLAETVERLVTDYQMRGPSPMVRAGEHDAGGRVAWKDATAGWEPVTTYGHGKDEMSGVYVWEAPPVQFDVHTGTTWLTAQLERLEYDPDIGDILEQFADLMSQCHALAPWREQVATLKGIPCPDCHQTSLARFGGDEVVTCLNRRCKGTFSPGRYAIWVRRLNEERRSPA